MTENVHPRGSPTSKTQYVYEWLKEEILSGALSPGAPIRQQDVAETLGVSYTPVREAIRQLQATGLINYEPNRGNAVNSLSSDALRELYLLRGVVEGLGARLAAEKVTDETLAELDAIHERMVKALEVEGNAAVLAALSKEFHATIVKAGGPLIVHAKAQEIWTHYPVPRSQSLWASTKEARRSIAAHAEILRALKNRDSDAAGRLMEDHIAGVVQFRLSDEL